MSPGFDHRFSSTGPREQTREMALDFITVASRTDLPEQTGESAYCRINFTRIYGLYMYFHFHFSKQGESD